MKSFEPNFIYKVSDWVMRISLLNLLWILFTIAGIGLIGLFPATAAMFTVVRHWIKKDVDVPVFRTFLHSFKESLLKANILGYISMIGGIVLYLDYLLVRNMSGSFNMIMMLLLLTITFYYVMVVFLVFPVYVHYDIKLMQCFKYAFIIGSAYPLRTIYIAFVSFVTYYITASFPVLLLFFSGSVLSMLIMRFSYVAFEKIAEQNNHKLAQSA